jgi:predicted flap endonuclease-1-like 5' DNA nuclease
MKHRTNEGPPMANIVDIEGIGPAYARRLEEAGVATVASLLTQGATPQGRKELAAKTKLSEARILKWVHRADLFRVMGVGEQYSDLLAAAGVETVLELAQRVPEHLHRKMQETNEAKHLVRVMPGVEHVSAWVREAKALPRVISY